MAEAQTHESDYFRAAQYLGWVDLKMNRFYPLYNSLELPYWLLSNSFKDLKRSCGALSSQLSLSGIELAVNILQMHQISRSGFNLGR